MLPRHAPRTRGRYTLVSGTTMNTVMITVMVGAVIGAFIRTIGRLDRSL